MFPVRELAYISGELIRPSYLVRGLRENIAKYSQERRFAIAWFILCTFLSHVCGVRPLMQSQQVPDELLALRDEIDRIDNELINLLAERFSVTAKVGQLKANNQLDSVDPVREQEKLERLRQLASDKSLNSHFILDLFQTIFDEVVKNHRSFLK